MDNMIYMQSSNTSDGRMLLDVSFRVGVDQDTANVLTQNRVTVSGAAPGGGDPAGRHRQEAEPQHLDGHLGHLARGELRRELPHQLLRHQPAGPAPPHPRDRPGRSLRRYRLRHARLARAQQAGQARTDAGRRDLGDQGAEPPGAGRAGRRRALPQGPAVHLHRGRRSGPPDHHGGVRGHHHQGHRDRRPGPDQGRGPGGARLPGLQLVRPAGWQAGRVDGRLSPARRGPAPGVERDLRDDEAGQGDFPARHGLQDRLRHDAGRRGVDRVDRPHLRRGADPRHARGVHLPPERAGHDHPAPDRARLDHRELHVLPMLGFSVNTLSMFGSCWPSASWWTTPSSWSRR